MFAQLEAGDPKLKFQWENIRKVTIEALSEVYSRLGIKFDYYHGEAMYGDAKVRALKNSGSLIFKKIPFALLTNKSTRAMNNISSYIQVDHLLLPFMIFLG